MKKLLSRVGASAGIILAAAPAFAQTSGANGSAIFAGVDMSTFQTSVTTILLVPLAIAVAFAAFKVTKRAVMKV